MSLENVFFHIYFTLVYSDEGDVTTIGLINNHGHFAQSSVIHMLPNDTPNKFLRTIITDKKQRGKMTTIMHDFTINNLDNRINMTGTLNVDQINRPEDLRRVTLYSLFNNIILKLRQCKGKTCN